MKINKSLLIAALSLFAISGLMAKQQSKKDEVPGVAPQPAEFFYTGKPYDKDLGAYTFNFRNYDPAMSRWTAADPSGFPDGVNNTIYVLNCPVSFFDDLGLSTIAWVFVSAPAPRFGGGTPISAQSQQKAAQAALTQTYNTTSSGNSANTLNPNLITVNNASDIQSAASSYGSIVLITHGDYSNNVYTINTTGCETLAGMQFLTPNQALGNLNNIFYATCYGAYSPNGDLLATGYVSTGNLLTWAQKITKNFLQE